MNTLAAVLTLFIVQFEGYYWDPCTYAGNIGSCYAVEGFDVPREVVFCDSIHCIDKILNERGIKYLEGVYQVNFDKYSIKDGSTATLNKLEVEHRVGVKDVQ